MKQNLPSTGSPLADEIVRRTWRQAQIAWVFAYLGLALMGYSLWSLRTTQVTLAKLSVQLDEKNTLLKQSGSDDVKEILTDHTRPKAITSRDELVAYLAGDGGFVFDRFVPKDEQAAFLTSVAPDPSVPGRYVATITTAAGEKRAHVFDVVAALHYVVP